jgi:hypothetical protein
MFESASKADPRSLPVQKLTLKTRFDIPNGTTLSLDEGLLIEFLERGDVTGRGINEVVGAFTINGRSHKFSFTDFRVTIAGITKEWRNDLAEDPIQARVHLVVRMYAQRFPYEETGRDL